MEQQNVETIVSPKVDFKIRANHDIVNQRVSKAGVGSRMKFLADQILTPSFISSDMQDAKLRKSDLLFKKKEPSVAAQGKTSVGGIVEDYVSTAMNHSMCSNGMCLRESRISQL